MPDTAKQSYPFFSELCNSQHKTIMEHAQDLCKCFSHSMHFQFTKANNHMKNSWNRFWTLKFHPLHLQERLLLQGLPAPALPAFRVQPNRAFHTTRVDFAGPLMVKDKEEPKTWLCLYTCASTRAVHLDLVPDLSTEAVLEVLCQERDTKSDHF